MIYSRKSCLGIAAYCVVASLLLCIPRSGNHLKLSKTRQQLQPTPPILALAPQSERRAQIQCNGSQMIVFRYGFGAGGFGDCLKGLVAILQIAWLFRRPFFIDFSTHPFSKSVPLRPELIAPPCIRTIPNSHSNVFNFADWLTSIDRRRNRDDAFSALKRGDISNLVMITNINHTAELASYFNEDIYRLHMAEQHFYASMYSLVIDGANLGTYWPAQTKHPYRIGLHLRMGDRHMSEATFNKNDDRIGDSGISELIEAIRAIPDAVSSRASGRTVQYFICADTASGRRLLRENLPNITVIQSPWDPVHIGYSGIAEKTEVVEESLNVVKEHFTLSTADELYMVTHSGFSSIACLASTSSQLVSKRCYSRNGSTWQLQSR